MTTIIRSLIWTLFVATAAHGTAQSQNTAPEQRLSNIRTQQPQETIFASVACQRVRETETGLIFNDYKVNENTLLRDLKTLMEKSDEVILGGFLHGLVVLSPSGNRPATYEEVRVIHVWKGPHHPGDVLTWGMPFGELPCESPAPPKFTPRLEVAPEGYGVPPELVPTSPAYNYAYLLFLRHAPADEMLGEGLRAAAGEGVQGIFVIPIVPEDHCFAPWGGVDVPHCDAILQASPSPIIARYPPDPLAKKYNGMSVSKFIKAIESLTAAKEPLGSPRPSEVASAP